MKKLIPHRILPYMILMKQFEKTPRLNIWGSLFYAALVISSTLIRWCTESPIFSGGGGSWAAPTTPPPPPNFATCIFHWLIHTFLNTYNPKRTLGSFLLFLYLLIAVLTAEGGRMGCFPSALMTTSISFGSLT